MGSHECFCVVLDCRWVGMKSQCVTWVFLDSAEVSLDSIGVFLCIFEV